MNKFFFHLLTAFILVSLASCKDPVKETIADSPTSGNLKVFCDKGLELQIKHQAYTFEKAYPGAKINLT